MRSGPAGPRIGVRFPVDAAGAGAILAIKGRSGRGGRMTSTFTGTPAAALVALVLAAAAPAAEPPEPANRVFIGAVRTGLREPAQAEAVGVRNGRIVFVGSAAAARAQAAPDAEIIALQKDAVIYPGLTDAHAHLQGVGARERTLNLDDVRSVAELVEKVKAAAANAPGAAPVIGRGWIETGWPEKRFPNRDDIDAAVPDRPVLLVRADGHALLANSAALAAAWVSDFTADPPGGRFERGEHGRLTGLVIDDAMGRFASFFGEVTPEEREKRLLAGAEVYARLGWTGMHNMSVSVPDVLTLERLAKEGRLPIRVYNAVDEEAVGELFATGPRIAADGRVTTRAVKIYIDGALGSRGALLSKPYADAPETSGLLRREKEHTQALFARALGRGLQLCIHAIGDQANALALDWIEETFAAVPEAKRKIAAPRWRIEHAQLLDPVDIPSFAGLGVIASMQPSHAIGDLHFAPARVGLDRLKGAYAWRSLMAAGAVVAGGSDAPVERGDPRIELYAAIARRDLKGFQAKGWRPEEAVSPAAALAMFTSAPAFASFREDELGAIAVGKRADLSVFDVDIFVAKPEAILKAKPLMTVVDGAIVWRAEP